MANILYLVHRLPYPPNKGDKVRSYHLLKHLAAKHRVFLGTFIDDPDDEQHLETVRAMCADLHVNRLSPLMARVRSLNGLLSNESLTLRYYRDGRMLEWVQETCRTESIDAAVIFSSSMAQYIQGIPRMRTLIDFVDVDSAKWTQYARQHRWPMSWLYRREGERLLAYERLIAARSARGFFVTDNETDLFRHMAPECSIRVETMCNGVESDFFTPDPSCPSPFAADEQAIVFTGAMDYLPNADAVTFFAKEVMPRILKQWPQARFHIVGRSPGSAVKGLAGPKVNVTGTVPDVRPYLQHAAVVVAPLRIARGVQNKILEAMAMARAVVTSVPCAEAIDATVGTELLTAVDAGEFASRVDELLRAPERARAIGEAARKCVVERYSWAAHMAGIDRHLEGAAGLGKPARGAKKK